MDPQSNFPAAVNGQAAAAGKLDTNFLMLWTQNLTAWQMATAELTAQESFSPPRHPALGTGRWALRQGWAMTGWTSAESSLLPSPATRRCPAR